MGRVAPKGGGGDRGGGASGTEGSSIGNNSSEPSAKLILVMRLVCTELG